ncbi:hypothetical protein GC089_06855 [Cellulomonas sp. JZ18]|uniref:ComEC/Rec2 family competence protein n=1 Tax=Cellulomonas sp. JZ18 TaxID=2654191 RepID=UPI0012D3DA5F|nr:ComEC/Rec2 family competence protein [Cellulomonas sp. JZ18]QGQ19002.1 hypothetical protein GC089_06855 [Cellulomonas sp. JZ18]
MPGRRRQAAADPAPPDAPRTDLRLLPSALAAWAAAAWVVLAPGPATVAVGAVAVPLAVALLLGPRRARRARTTPAVLLATAVAASVLVAGGLQEAASRPAGLVAAARAGTAVEVVGRVAEPPRVRSGGAGPTRTHVPVVAAEVREAATGRLIAADVPLVLLVEAEPDHAGPAGGDLPPLGTRLVAQGRARPGQPGDRAAATVALVRPPTVSSRPGPWSAWSAAARGRATALAAALPGDAGALLPGVTVGDTATVPDDLAQAMRAAGLSHLTAVSGAHFALVGALVLGVAGAVRAPVPVRALLVAGAGAALVLVVGPAPSVVRAAAMGAVGLLALLAGRRSVGPAALCTAVVVLLVHDPWLALAPGFALSVAATAGLVAVGPRLVARWSPWCRRTGAAALAAPVAAQLGCLPVVLALWPTLGVWSVPANLVAAPVVAPATVLGLAAVLVAPWWPAGRRGSRRWRGPPAGGSVRSRAPARRCRRRRCPGCRVPWVWWPRC